MRVIERSSNRNSPVSRPAARQSPTMASSSSRNLTICLRWDAVSELNSRLATSEALYMRAGSV